MPEKGKFYVTQYAAIFDKENRLLLLRDAVPEHSILGKYVFPGGHINMEDDPVSALAREIKEETNLKMTAAWVFSTAIKKYPDGDWRFIVYYVCHAKGSVKLDKDHDAFEWTDLAQTKKMKFRDNEEKQIIIGLLERKKGAK